MDSESRARAPSAKSAARVTPSRRRTRMLLMLAGMGALLLLAWGTVALRRADSTQARQQAEGVWLAQRRMGEAPPGPPAVALPRSPTSSLPATPTSLPMPGPQPTAKPRPSTEPRYVVRDSTTPRPAPGHLFVDTQPEAQVWIDGEAKGKTPLDVQVGPGSKALRLEADGFHPLRETFEAGQGAIIRRALVPLGAPP